MLNEETVAQILKEIIRNHPDSYTNVIKKLPNYKEFVNAIVLITSRLPKEIKLKTRIYWILNSLEEAPRCQNNKCNREMLDVNVRNVFAGYPKHCCKKCAQESESRKKKYRDACEKHFGKGVINSFQAESVKEKRKKTYLETLGVDNPAKSEIIKNKTKDTCLQRYDVEYAWLAQKSKDATLKTLLERYNATSYSKTDEFIKKMEKTNLERCDYAYPMQNPEIRRQAQKKYKYQGISFDSALELYFYIYGVDNKVKFTFHPKVSFTYTYKEKIHNYQPDFEVNGQLIELKGLHFFENKDPTKRMINPFDHTQDDLYEAKHQCMLKNNIRILTEVDLKDVITGIEKKYGKDFYKKFKI